MSALGHKRTCAVQKGMSALPPIADMGSATRYVRFVPKADIPGGERYVRFVSIADITDSVDHLVGAGY